MKNQQKTEEKWKFFLENNEWYDSKFYNFQIKYFIIFFKYKFNI